MFPAPLTGAAAQERPQEPARPVHSVRIYELRDLLMASAEASDTPRSREWLSSEDGRAERERRMASGREHFERILKTYLQPPFDPQRDQLRITEGDSLVAQLRPEQLEWLDAFLKRQRSEPRMIEVELKILGAPLGALRALAKGTDPLVLETPEQQRAFDEALSGIAGLEKVSTPRFRFWERVQTSISVTDKLAYLKDWKLETVEPGPQTIADPVIATIDEGYRVGTRTVEIDALTIDLEVELEWSQVRRPIPTKKIELDTPGRTEVEIALPEVDRIRIESTVRIAPDAKVVFFSLPGSLRDIAVIARARPVEEGESVK
ncbi:MAG TPA: hypothetical protein VMS76_02500 [Planctomycetota bacterium]|nr:hypothetical protein [Planctomycetota bacterium]